MQGVHSNRYFQYFQFDSSERKYKTWSAYANLIEANVQQPLIPQRKLIIPLKGRIQFTTEAKIAIQHAQIHAERKWNPFREMPIVD